MSNKIPVGSPVRLRSDGGNGGPVCIVIGVSSDPDSPGYQLGVVEPQSSGEGVGIRPLRDDFFGPDTFEVLQVLSSVGLSPSTAEEEDDTTDSEEMQVLETQEKRWGRADRYLQGLGLPVVKGNAEKRAALHAWNGHDVATGVPMVTAMVGALGTLAGGGLAADGFLAGGGLAADGFLAGGGLAVGGVIAVLGATLISLIRWDDGRRVMAEAVLKVRDSPRPSLRGEEGSAKSSTSIGSGTEAEGGLMPVWSNEPPRGLTPEEMESILAQPGAIQPRREAADADPE